MVHQPGVLLLAAGQGRRYRQAGGVGDKLMAPCPYDDGQIMPLFEVALRHAMGSGLRVHVVTLPGAEGVLSIAARYACPVTTLVSQGMGESIAAGVLATSHWPGWLIQPADMPHIFPKDYRALCTALRTDSLVRMSWQGQPGHPVGFSPLWYSELSQLTGDPGARYLLANKPVRVLESHQGVVTDWDLPQTR